MTGDGYSEYPLQRMEPREALRTARAIQTDADRIFGKEPAADRPVRGVELVTLDTRILCALVHRGPRIAQEDLARRLGVTVRTIQRYLEDLEREGYVERVRDRKPHAYVVKRDKPVPGLPGWTVGQLVRHVRDD